MSADVFINKLTTINGKFDAWIRPIQQELIACEQALASLGTPIPGKLAPAMSVSASHEAEKHVLEVRMRALVEQFNRANRDWLNELRLVPRPGPVAGLRQQIPWPSWVGDKGQDFVMRCIDQGGLPISDRVTLKKAPGTWTGVMIEYDW